MKVEADIDPRTLSNLVHDIISLNDSAFFGDSGRRRAIGNRIEVAYGRYARSLREKIILLESNLKNKVLDIEILDDATTTATNTLLKRIAELEKQLEELENDV